MAPSNTNTDNVTGAGQLIITVSQVSQNAGANTSQVQVVGKIKNTDTVRAFNLDANISCSISGTQSFTGPDFSFDLSPGESKTFINHTFTLTHDSDGTKSCSFTVHYGNTGVANFGSNKSLAASLTLTRIPKAPTKPGTPVASNELPTSLTLTWTAPSDSQGSAIKNYILRQYAGPAVAGTPIENSGNSLTRNLTGLTPGATYTFTVVAVNSSVQNSGVSPASTALTITLLPGAHIRVDGVWKTAVPYIRDSGDWKPAVPYVRNGGVWTLTE
jgi:Fibronectin type III domain/Siphovirus protein of unknown function (DUF859)